MKAQGQVKEHGEEQDGMFARGFKMCNDSTLWGSSPAPYSRLILAVSVLVAGIQIKSIPASLLGHLFCGFFLYFQQQDFRTLWETEGGIVSSDQNKILLQTGTFWLLHLLMHGNYVSNFTQTPKKKVTILPSVTIKNCTITLNNTTLHSTCKQQNIQQRSPESIPVT